MRHVASALLAFFLRFGGAGLLVIGILDSSFLFAPFGNDILIVAVSARTHNVWLMLYYSLMSAVGSVLGCLLVDVVFRSAGERGLERHLSRRRLNFIRRKVSKNAAWALALASLAPPPFPFTPFVMVAAALQYERRRLLTVVGVARMVRFTALGVLALLFGRSIVQWAESDFAQISLTLFIALCVLGSALSVYGWIRRSRGLRGSPRR